MDNSQSTGSFGAATGGMSPELQQAIASRSGQSLVTSQVTNGSPNAQPMPQVQGSSQMVSGGATSPQNSTPERIDDAHIILNAMAERLKSQNKIAEAQNILPKMGG